MLRRTARLAAMALTALMLAFIPAGTASANTLYMTIWWIRCDDQSEPGSDEIRLRFAGQGPAGIAAAWSDVDGGETHWYYSSEWGFPVNMTFTGDHNIDVYELDSELSLIGWVSTSASEVDTGPKEKRMAAFDGDYVIRYEIRSTPCC